MTNPTFQIQDQCLGNIHQKSQLDRITNHNPKDPLIKTAQLGQTAKQSYSSRKIWTIQEPSMANQTVQIEDQNVMNTTTKFEFNPTVV